MAEYEVHAVDYSDTTDEEWDDPQLYDFDMDDLSEVDDTSCSRRPVPPESFSALQLPVVDPDGNLNRNALQTAYSSGHGVEAIDDIDEETIEGVRNRLLDLAEEGFGIGENELEEPPS
ncbi:hypothetical protein [Natronorarus salvus]|uniref:hypothetical protein n=1 Tax=Natronorarus salvus TaxID=3117733 RepID=UPI002F26CCF4